MPYKFLEETATADIAFEAWGKDLNETFTAAGEATMNVMVEELEAIQPLESRQIQIQNEQLDMFLFDFLQELIYYKDAERLLLRLDRIQIQGDTSPFSLSAVARGETLDPERHHPRVDVKAVTLHQFRLEKSAGGWKAFVILDI